MDDELQRFVSVLQFCCWRTASSTVSWSRISRAEPGPPGPLLLYGPVGVVAKYPLGHICTDGWQSSLWLTREVKSRLAHRQCSTAVSHEISEKSVAKLPLCSYVPPFEHSLTIEGACMTLAHLYLIHRYIRHLFDDLSNDIFHHIFITHCVDDSPQCQFFSCNHFSQNVLICVR